MLCRYPLLTARPPPISTLFPYTTLFRSMRLFRREVADGVLLSCSGIGAGRNHDGAEGLQVEDAQAAVFHPDDALHLQCRQDRKSTRLNSSHSSISYAVFCLTKKKSMKHE